MTMLKNYIAIVTLSIAVILYMSLASSKFFRIEEYYNSVKLTLDVSTWETNVSFPSSSNAGSKNPILPTLCSYRPKATNCPLLPHYKKACSDDAEKRFREKLKSMEWQGVSLQRLEEAVGNRTDDLLVKLRSIFHRRRVVLVGDSLMRQWFETLSCRLGMPSTWFELNGLRGNTDPSKRLERIVNTSGIVIAPLKSPPAGLANSSGYSIASTEISSLDNTTDFCGFETKIEYVRYDVTRPGHKISNLWNALMMPHGPDDAIYEKETLLILNLGIHYTKKSRESYTKDLNKVLEACGVMNRIEPAKVRCLFRDITPQHHLIKSPAEKFPVDWQFNRKDLGQGCSPFDEFQNKVIFPNHTDWYRMAESHGVPVIKIMDNPIWIDAWNYHEDNDCTHYCQDSMLWDVLHWTFVNLLEKEDPSAFLSDSE
jgi:hypothetical protein